jgi:hypothetical protein
MRLPSNRLPPCPSHPLAAESPTSFASPPASSACAPPRTPCSVLASCEGALPQALSNLPRGWPPQSASLACQSCLALERIGCASCTSMNCLCILPARGDAFQGGQRGAFSRSLARICSLAARGGVPLATSQLPAPLHSTARVSTWQPSTEVLRAGGSTRQLEARYLRLSEPPLPRTHRSNW